MCQIQRKRGCMCWLCSELFARKALCELPSMSFTEHQALWGNNGEVSSCAWTHPTHYHFNFTSFLMNEDLKGSKKQYLVTSTTVSNPLIYCIFCKMMADVYLLIFMVFLSSSLNHFLQEDKLEEGYFRRTHLSILSLFAHIEMSSNQLRSQVPK